MPETKKSLALPLIGALLLAVVCFFIGRYSVGETDTPKDTVREDRESTGEKERTLTALKKPVLEQADAFEKKDPGVPERSELSEREEHALKTVSEYIAAFADQLGDLDELQPLIGEWIKTDPDSAIEWLATGERRDDILRLIFVGWAAEDLEGATAWLESHRGVEDYSSAVVGVALGLMMENQYEEALDWADSLDDPLARTQIWNEAGGEAYEVDPDGTLDRLADSGIPDELQLPMLEQWNQRIRNRSRRNAQNLASVYSAAVAAGANFHGRSSQEVVRELVAGVTGGDVFSETTFQVPNMDDTAIEKALGNLEFHEGQLNYNPAE